MKKGNKRNPNPHRKTVREDAAEGRTRQGAGQGRRRPGRGRDSRHHHCIIVFGGKGKLNPKKTSGPGTPAHDGL